MPVDAFCVAVGRDALLHLRTVDKRGGARARPPHENPTFVGAFMPLAFSPIALLWCSFYEEPLGRGAPPMSGVVD